MTEWIVVCDAPTEHDVAHSGHLSVPAFLHGKPLLSQDLAAGAVLGCLTAVDCDTALISKLDEAQHPLFWFGKLPLPEDYIARGSRETLEGILKDGEWEGGRSKMVSGRLRETIAMSAN